MNVLYGCIILMGLDALLQLIFFCYFRALTVCLKWVKVVISSVTWECRSWEDKLYLHLFCNGKFHLFRDVPLQLNKSVHFVDLTLIYTSGGERSNILFARHWLTNSPPHAILTASVERICSVFDRSGITYKNRYMRKKGVVLEWEAITELGFTIMFLHVYKCEHLYVWVYRWPSVNNEKWCC